MFTIPASVTGTGQTGFTSPTYTLTQGTAPTQAGKQGLVTALGGTQPGVSVNSPLIPFRLNLITPLNIRSAAPQRSNANQLIANNRNKWLFIGAKGGLLIPASNIYGQMDVKFECNIPAGMETASPAEIRAFWSLFGGWASSKSSEWAETMIAGG